MATSAAQDPPVSSCLVGAALNAVCIHPNAATVSAIDDAVAIEYVSKLAGEIRVNELEAMRLNALRRLQLFLSVTLDEDHIKPAVKIRVLRKQSR
eukprot:CAMPEP_0180415874 /NCGR_PEP_ID=MMETSP1036_2-20121128/162_1 /TAXON_ID=632150 /ORGANISM="Azadinium spinosum, Strain 3D9" /LENGTH=94 /DNA_ID=CAMNT_0022420725 /DNA_START=185 /DNA_END=470 /DNA_ORIENTATION=+